MPTLPEHPQTQGCTAHDPFAIMRSCHDHVLAEMRTLAKLADTIESDGEIEVGSLAGLGHAVCFMHGVLPLHTADEEQTFFPAVRATGALGDEGTPMDVMESEHIQHKQLLSELTRAVVKRDVPRVVKAARAIVFEYHTHIGKENDCLYPMAQQILTDPAQLAALAEEMHARRRAAGMVDC